ncbi:hypothetical protein [Glaesserella sp.]|uniref:hypothetical protein n=1 Tax=Glaesserella sp. TaxID=2094731 RepID=UPI0035A18D91
MVDKSTMFADNSDMVYRRAVMLEEGRGVEKNLGEAFSDYLNVFNFGSAELKQKAAARLCGSES